METAQETAQETAKQTIQMIQMIQDNLPAIGMFFLKIILTIVIYIIFSRIIKWICKILKQSMNKASVPPEAVSFITSLVKVGLYALLVFNLSTQFGVQASSVAALLASAGVGVSLALQGGLSNFAGGVIILFLKPFTVGDYIIEANGKNEGTVLKIEMYYTTLLTMDNRRIVIPNSILTGNTITNVTAMDERKLEIKVGISYRANLLKAKRVLETIIREEPRIEKEKEIMVFVDALDDSSVSLGLRVWVKTDDYWPVKWAMNEKIKLTFDREGIEIPYPQMDIHLSSNALTTEGKIEL